MAGSSLPAWLWPPPAEAATTSSPLAVRTGQPAVTLVSAALGPATYLRPLERFRKSWRAGGFNSSLLWTARELHADALYKRFAREFDALAKHRQRRPYCAAFKPLAILRALLESCDGDYVLWADSSKYHPKQALNWTRPGGQPGVHEAVAALRGGSAYGQVHCKHQCDLGERTFMSSSHFTPQQGTLLSQRTIDGFAPLVQPSAKAALGALPSHCPPCPHATATPTATENRACQLTRPSRRTHHSRSPPFEHQRRATCARADGSAGARAQHQHAAAQRRGQPAAHLGLARDGAVATRRLLRLAPGGARHAARRTLGIPTRHGQGRACTRVQARSAHADVARRDSSAGPVGLDRPCDQPLLAHGQHVRVPFERRRLPTLLRRAQVGQRLSRSPLARRVRSGELGGVWGSQMREAAISHDGRAGRNKLAKPHTTLP